MKSVFQWKPFLTSLAISIGTGLLSGVITGGDFSLYQQIQQPPLSPPTLIFPIVWTVLYILMGISAYLIWIRQSSAARLTLRIYIVQLAVNFLWPIFFFKAQWYFFSLVWLLILLYLVIRMIREFTSIEPVAGYLQIPYFVWLVFAAYLNLGVWILNS